MREFNDQSNLQRVINEGDSLTIELIGTSYGYDSNNSKITFFSEDIITPKYMGFASKINENGTIKITNFNFPTNNSCNYIYDPKKNILFDQIGRRNFQTVYHTKGIEIAPRNRQKPIN